MKLYSLLSRVFICTCLLCFITLGVSGQCFTNYTLAPTTSASGPNGTYCGPVYLQLSGSQSSSVSYQLVINGANFGSAQWGNTGPLTFGPIPTSNGGGTCMVYASQNGSSCSPTLVGACQLYLIPNPSGEISASNGSTTVCPNSPVVLTVAANNTTGTGYQWLNGGAAISGATSPSYTVTQSGTYSVQLSNSCNTVVTVNWPVTYQGVTGLGPMSSITPNINVQQATYNNLPTTFTASATNASGYIWTLSQPGAGYISGTGSTATVTWNSGFVGDVTVTVTGIGCGVSTSALNLNVLPTNGTTFTNQVQNYLNYVKESDVRVSGITTSAAVETINPGQKNVTFNYYNGLGQPEQKVLQMASSNNDQDIVQQFDDDQYGREAVKYLPYTSTTQNGSYHPYNISELLAYYNSATQPYTNIVATPFPYSETNFENSALNRVVEQGAPGDVWQLTGKPTAVSPGHTVKMDYTTNDNSTFSATNINGSKNVVLYVATVNSDQSRTLSIGLNGVNNYAPGTLRVTITKDENWTSANGVLGTVEEYKNNQGQLLLKRTYATGTGGTLELSTYYVYDDFGNLCFVLTPASMPDAGLPSQSIINNTSYEYRYDQKNRLVQKKLPTKAWDFIVYNNIDKVILTQDGMRRLGTPQAWLFYKYDALGRVAMTGLWTYANSTGDTNPTSPNLTYLQTLEQNYLATTNPLWESRNNTTTTGYNNVTDPTGSFTYYTINYYDGYSAPSGKIPSKFTLSTASQMTRGLLTATFTDVVTTTNMLCSVTFYDDLGRVTNTFKQHYVGGYLSNNNYDQIVTNYNFDNSLNTVSRNHYTNAGGTPPVVTILNTYVYDLLGREKQLLKSFNSAANVILSQTNYNEVGQVVAKNLHSTNNGTSFLQSINYTYNERGWLSSINSPTSVTSTQSFGEQLYYGNNPNTTLNLYNGNISTVKWQTLSTSGSIPQMEQEFDYTYDKINRLLTSHYTNASGTNAGGYDENLTYDYNGNISTLNRWGVPNGVQQIDQLSYTYSGDQLSSVNDAITAYPQGQISGTTTYTYDFNGNQTADSKKETTVSYNVLNLPQSVTQTGNSSTLVFMYDANGRLLRKTYGTATRDYDDGIEYNGTTLEQVHTEEGRAVNEGGTYMYEYFLKDHLGNTRLSEQSNGNFYQYQDYYAFGMDMPNETDASPDNRYKYNGKEFETEIGLNEYNYGARFYDPVITRWTSLDPLADAFENVTPYSYAANNPVSMIDPDGMSTESADGFGKPKPKPKPIVLKEVKITATRLYRITRKSLGDPEMFLKFFHPPKLRPLKGFWEMLGYYWSGRDVNGINYDDEGNPRGPSPTIGIVNLPVNFAGSIEEFELIMKTVDAATEAEKDIQFGKDANQLYHALRHLKEIGLNSAQIEKILIAIKQDASVATNLVTDSKVVVNNVVIVDGIKITYSAFKLPSGVINIGRIVP